ncbi:hypothetical protein ACPOL_6911 (plasmid) [Acidisarcina polymorpha]|uniref:Uncharacterized protein n=1 Tax=Acidisarcina polymorpha TaxID=2211140 RepID=A0A2Z5GAU8_9BACT|nr:hypothetical protein ACPOL_6911 [Acidisarcina polymorpha]
MPHFSGHGFKFSSVIGDTSDMVAGVAPGFDLEPVFYRGRFQAV